MTNRPINQVCVVGSGFMGSQIGLQCAVHGRDVRMYDVSEPALTGAARYQAEILDEQIRSGLASADQREAILGRIRCSTSLQDSVAGVDLVIEAVHENLDLKRE